MTIETTAGDWATPEEIERARALYAVGSDDCIEVDNSALVSRPDQDEGGVWVQAWVWVPTPHGEEESE